MALCGPNRCGCALRSTSLSISGDGSTTNPWTIDSLLGQFGGRFFEFASDAERNAHLTAVTASEGDVAYIRDAPNRLTYYDGSAWNIFASEWTTWTPSFTNLTTTSGTITARYAYVSMRTVRVVMHFGFGASSAMGSTPTCSLPVAMATGLEPETAPVTYSDATGPRFYGRLAWNGASNVVFLVHQVAGSYISGGVPTSTIPFTWAVNDQIRFDITYEV